MDEQTELMIDLHIYTGFEKISLYENLIYSTWLKGFYFGNVGIQEMPRSIFFKYFHFVIDDILKSPHTYLKTISLKIDEDSILSYAVIEELENVRILHWIYTKERWRKKGLAKKLIPEKIDYVSHMTQIGKSIKPRGWIYNPFLKNGEIL